MSQRDKNVSITLIMFLWMHILWYSRPRGGRPLGIYSLLPLPYSFLQHVFILLIQEDLGTLSYQPTKPPPTPGWHPHSHETNPYQEPTNREYQVVFLFIDTTSLPLQGEKTFLEAFPIHAPSYCIHGEQI